MKHYQFALAIAATAIHTLMASSAQADEHQFDIVIYGGTSAAVSAAVQAKRMHKSVAIVCPEKHLGGLSSSGLGFTDTGNKAVIGGISREFYHRVWQEYQKSETWRWQKPEEYGNKGQGTAAIDGAKRTMWIFEPHIAEKVFEDFMKEDEIPTFRDQWLDREHGVTKDGQRIVSIKMISGESFAAKEFIDASYEGDLMAAAGVAFDVGRESQDAYKERWAGVQTDVLQHRHHFAILPAISPYKVPGDASSGLLPLISADPPGKYGSADKRIQAYCYRMCLTNDEANRVPFAKPEGYDPSRYELLKRVYEAGWRETFDKFDPIPNHKTDTNNHGPLSTDYIGANYDYPEASYARRKEILEDHRRYELGWFYFIANDPSVPKDVQAAVQQWGLPKDEFADNEHWPYQIYVRESRRMIGQYVMTEHELLGNREVEQPISMGSYTIDSHNVQRYITEQGRVQNEGDIGVHTPFPYKIALGCIIPKEDQCTNLTVPVCVSSTHVAFGSIRMEPVFMILGQSAATLAAMAIEKGSTTQAVPYEAIKQRLIDDAQVLHYETAVSGAGIDPAALEGIVVDDRSATKSGKWETSQVNTPFIAHGYVHDGNQANGPASIKFEAKLKPGKYEVRLYYPPNENRASNAKVAIVCGSQRFNKSVYQRATDAGQSYRVVGSVECSKEETCSVALSNESTDGYVVADAVQWLPISER